MRACIVACAFTPEPYNVCTNLEDLAKEMSRRGHDVTVICPHPNRPFGRLAEGYPGGWLHEYRRDGYRVLRCWHWISKSSTYASRFAENASFGVASSWRLLREDRFDVAYLFNWTTIAQGLNSKLLRFRGVPVVSCTRDIYPEVLIARRGLSPRGWVARVLHALDVHHLRRCDHVVTLDDGMASLLESTRGVSAERMSIVPIWASEATPQPTERRRQMLRRRLGVTPGQLLAVYAGGLGLGPDLELYVEAAQRLAPRPDIRIRLVGSGSMGAVLRRWISERGLTNIDVLDSAPLSDREFAELQAVADVLLLPLPAGLNNVCAPSKLVSYLALGRAILASAADDSSVARTVVKANAGFVTPAGDAVMVADKLAEIADKPWVLDTLGANSKRYASAHLSRPRLLKQLADLLETVGSQEECPSGATGSVR